MISRAGSITDPNKYYELVTELVTFLFLALHLKKVKLVIVLFALRLYQPRSGRHNVRTLASDTVLSSTDSFFCTEALRDLKTTLKLWGVKCE
jgi:hypothetical protein